MSSTSSTTIYTDHISRAFDILRKQKYHMIGSHSAVKKCYWVHKALTEKMFCYKAKFYGIESHRCIQFSPAVLWCWNYCLHCWRYRVEDWNTKTQLRVPENTDDPRMLVDMAIREHKRTISGYRRYPNVDPTAYREAMTPKHVAISLTGEPTLYLRLDELIEEFHKRNLTTFLVTRGIRPEILANLRVEPTQLYVSIEAFDEHSYAKFNNPASSILWQKTLETLEILPSFTCPTVIRITLIRGFNMNAEASEKWTKLLLKAYPTFIEVKAYMHIGVSTTRLTRNDMPSHDEVKKHAQVLANMIGYSIVSESRASRVVLLSRIEKPVIRYGNPPISWHDIEKIDEEHDEYNSAQEVV
ncbi:MAG: 4-demethylwyosine synthase TYW1 [Ignisphaera sp.]|nr:4-demethylwyosine synthase TYW1 [Ignisphaera sp.]MDW8085189.1 4-demethylwyosine synthase TYW1 [Ignisphaera sp.]